MCKHLSSRVKMIWLLFFFSLDIQSKKRTDRANVATTPLTSLKSRADGEPRAVSLLRFLQLILCDYAVGLSPLTLDSPTR